MLTQQGNLQQLKTEKYNPLIEDTATINGLMKAFYEVVSGEAGKKRQWERDLSIHNPNAIYSYISNVNGELKQLTLSVKDFHKETDDMVLETAFYETEINREVKVFGNIANVWSTYETRLEKNGIVARRGINSIQLFYADDRWEIISVVFDRETENNRIPQTFDPK
ncbi:hypothetical protein SAMN05443667_105128 [Flavobacterium gillisiae]|uniref:Nuclear transport factor 2 family protein n=1 Tax=Flavobacterium gillisiae TaxID=150146 RepID=A0A1H4BY36_9FLAO|nr:hypothetical protein [Flavobacterium gillisiae]SEA52999.1 hypothetical protein SAMN05443667_105128 [Flavobacterium gillisiae]